jgi:hypothetical protein
MGPVPLVLDLHIAHECFGSTSDPRVNWHLHYPNDLDRPLNETVTDKIRSYRPDYKNRPSNTIYCIPDIDSTSGRIHSEFVWLLFLQGHRETDHFLHLQEFNLRILPVVSSTTAVRRSPPSLSRRLTTFSPSLEHCGLAIFSFRLQHYRLLWI